MAEPGPRPGATSENQPEILTTQFKADASFDQVRLCHDGGGDGWIFSAMAIATSFGDFIVIRFWQTWWFVVLVFVSLLAGVVMSVRISERRKYQRRLHRAESERALERERARIARDLHDDLGSSLARISLLSSLARDDKEHPEQVLAHVTKIAQSADDTVRALEEIVWAVRPDSDSLQSLVEYIAHFSNELFEGTHPLPARFAARLARAGAAAGNPTQHLPGGQGGADQCAEACRSQRSPCAGQSKRN